MVKSLWKRINGKQIPVKIYRYFTYAKKCMKFLNYVVLQGVAETSDDPRRNSEAHCSIVNRPWKRKGRPHNDEDGDTAGQNY